MASAIAGFTPSTPVGGSPLTTKTLTGGDFLNLMIQQLQQQDPLNPTDSNQLLTQMSQISQLQSSTDMMTSLQGLTLQQSIGAAGNLIGKNVSGLDDAGNPIAGLVTSIKVVDKKARLELDSGKDLAMENVTQIAAASQASTQALQNLLPQLQSSLQNGVNINPQSLSSLAQMLSALKSAAPAATG